MFVTRPVPVLVTFSYGVVRLGTSSLKVTFDKHHNYNWWAYLRIYQPWYLRKLCIKEPTPLMCVQHTICRAEALSAHSYLSNAHKGASFLTRGHRYSQGGIVTHKGASLLTRGHRYSQGGIVTHKGPLYCIVTHFGNQCYRAVGSKEKWNFKFYNFKPLSQPLYCS